MSIEWFEVTLSLPYITNFVVFASVYIALGSSLLVILSFRAALDTSREHQEISWMLFLISLIIWPLFAYYEVKNWLTK